MQENPEGAWPNLRQHVNKGTENTNNRYSAHARVSAHRKRTEITEKFRVFPTRRRPPSGRFGPCGTSSCEECSVLFCSTPTLAVARRLSPVPRNSPTPDFLPRLRPQPVRGNSYGLFYVSVKMRSCVDKCRGGGGYESAEFSPRLSTAVCSFRVASVGHRPLLLRFLRDSPRSFPGPDSHRWVETAAVALF